LINVSLSFNLKESMTHAKSYHQGIKDESKKMGIIV